MLLAGEHWNYLKKNLSSCYSVKQKFHTGCPGIYNNLWKLKCFTVFVGKL
jgi:hypothetical protein